MLLKTKQDEAECSNASKENVELERLKCDYDKLVIDFMLLKTEVESVRREQEQSKENYCILEAKFNSLYEFVQKLKQEDVGEREEKDDTNDGEKTKVNEGPVTEDEIMQEYGSLNVEDIPLTAVINNMLHETENNMQIVLSKGNECSVRQEKRQIEPSSMVSRVKFRRGMKTKATMSKGGCSKDAPRVCNLV